jgi:hypothetical protein
VGVAFADEILGLLLRFSAVAGSIGDAATGAGAAGLGLAESMVCECHMRQCSHGRQRRCAVAAVDGRCWQWWWVEEKIGEESRGREAKREGWSEGGEREEKDGRDLLCGQLGGAG